MDEHVIDFEQKKYLWNGSCWLDYRSRLSVPQALAKKLTRQLENEIGKSNIPKKTTTSVFFCYAQYADDMNKLGKTYQLNQNNELLYKVQKDDHVWAFAKLPLGYYVLVIDLVVNHTRKNQSSDLGYSYGKYCAVGDPNKSRYFGLQNGLNADNLIVNFNFYNKESKVKSIGQMFRGMNAVRSLTIDDETKIIDLANSSPIN